MAEVKHESTPNWRGMCEWCASEFERYVRPSKNTPRFCSNGCRMQWLGRREKSEAHRHKLGRPKERHHRWTGDDVSEKGGRARALRWFSDQPCDKCGETKADRHHKNGDTSNNDAANIEFLCRKCHMTDDGRIERMREVRYGISRS